VRLRPYELADAADGKDAFPPDEREDYRDVIMSNTLQSIRVVLEAMPTFDLGPSTPESERAADVIATMDDDTVVDASGRMLPRVVSAIKALWADPNVRRCVEFSAQYQLNDSATYFFGELDRIGSPEGYVPTDQDILRARVKVRAALDGSADVSDDRHLRVLLQGRPDDVPHDGRRWTAQRGAPQRCGTS